jgi:hypothetical protein
MTTAIKTITTTTPASAPFYTTTTEEVEYNDSLSFGAIVASNFDGDMDVTWNWRGVRYTSGISYILTGAAGEEIKVYTIVSEVKDCGNMGRRAVWDD